MGRRYDTVSFLTDWGVTDEFVGVVKAVLRDLAPHASVIDLTHHIRPFDVRAGSLALARSISYLPSGIVLAVVDPGVGSDRRALAIEVAGGDGVLVGPDNGLLAPAVAIAGGAERAVQLDNPGIWLDAPGATFAGRDVFAPAVAHLCNGGELADLGSEVDPHLLVPGMVPLPKAEGDALHADVLWVDHFGNCQLNVGPDELDGWGPKVRVEVGDDVRIATRESSFAGTGISLGLVPDSTGMLALVLDRRSASEELRLLAGDQIVLRPLDEGDAGPIVVRPVVAAVSLGRSRPAG
ncbi:MAG: SAM-dependent chlorinase/fluorinase [Ilumatobacteraceae bacterium]